MHNYLFFDVAKDIMKTVVNMVNNFRNNIIKIGGLEALQGVVTAMLDTVMTGILLEIFMREKNTSKLMGLILKKCQNHQTNSKTTSTNSAQSGIKSNV